MSRKNNKYGYSSITGEEILRYVKIAAIPVVVIILILVIIFAGKGKDENGGAESQPSTEAAAVPEASSEAEESAAETSAAEEQAAVGANEALAKDEVPEVNELVERYFTAKQSADVETIYSLFGRTDTDGMEELRSEYSYTSRYTEGYDNIVCYTKPGPEEGSYLVYVSYDLKFKNVETLAPGLFRVYAAPNAEGTLQLVDTSQMDPEIEKLFDETEQTDELILLRTQVYAKLRQALETDPELAGVYGVLQKNSQFTEEETRGDSSVSIVTETGIQIEGSAAAGETEAPSEETAAPAESGETAESAPSDTESSSGDAGSASPETESSAEGETSAETESQEQQS